jgi:hypothetical protein
LFLNYQLSIALPIDHDPLPVSDSQVGATPFTNPATVVFRIIHYRIIRLIYRFFLLERSRHSQPAPICGRL